MARPVRSILREAADRARAAIEALPHQAWGETVGMGADGTPTSRVDRVAETAIREALEGRDVEVNLLSEEAEPEERGVPWTLVVDPVDGTHNAITGLPNYAISLALCEGDLRGAGYALVEDLSTGWLYEAERQKGAWRNGEPIHVRPYRPEQSLFALYLGTNAHPKALQLAHLGRRIRHLGAASLDMCLVAEGAADLYYMRTTAPAVELRITDVAASTLIVREAGGEVYDLEGNALNMPLDVTHRSSLFALGDPELLEVVL